MNFKIPCLPWNYVVDVFDGDTVVRATLTGNKILTEKDIRDCPEIKARPGDVVFQIEVDEKLGYSGPKLVPAQSIFENYMEAEGMQQLTHMSMFRRRSSVSAIAAQEASKKCGASSAETISRSLADDADRFVKAYQEPELEDFWNPTSLDVKTGDRVFLLTDDGAIGSATITKIFEATAHEVYRRDAVPGTHVGSFLYQIELHPSLDVEAPPMLMPASELQHLYIEAARKLTAIENEYGFYYPASTPDDIAYCGREIMPGREEYVEEHSPYNCFNKLAI